MDLREQIARAIYAKRPDCERKPWPLNTDKDRRAYQHNPIAAVELSYIYADAAIEVLASHRLLSSLPVGENDPIREGGLRDGSPVPLKLSQ